MKQKLVMLSCLILALFAFGNIKITTLAEQSGSSPESGTSSYIKTAYDWLVAKGANYGATDAADWSNDWGTYWNRIMESAAWEPDGTAAVGDVTLGTTFYAGNGNRTIKTGTYDPFTTIYTPQSLVEWDDYKNGDETGEEASWTNSAGTATGGVWKDNRTGLYWSANQGNFTNVFPDDRHTTCPFFSNRITYDGLTGACGDAINACGVLSLEGLTGQGAKTDWYLPSQKELMQVYIDGAYNQNATWATTSYFWSSTEVSDNPTYAWGVSLSSGDTGNDTPKVTSSAVRCVRRD